MVTPTLLRYYSEIILYARQQLLFSKLFPNNYRKPSRDKKFKKINLPNVGMGGLMEALADKVHKQEEHCTFYNIAIFHTTIPT